MSLHNIIECMCDSWVIIPIQWLTWFAGVQGHVVVKIQNGNGDFAVILFNMGDQPTAIEESFKDIGIVYSKAVVYDIWQHKEIGTAEGTVTAKVESHGVAFYRLTPQ